MDSMKARYENSGATINRHLRDIMAYVTARAGLEIAARNDAEFVFSLTDGEGKYIIVQPCHQAGISIGEARVYISGAPVADIINFRATHHPHNFMEDVGGWPEVATLDGLENAIRTARMSWQKPPL